MLFSVYHPEESISIQVLNWMCCWIRGTINFFDTSFHLQFIDDHSLLIADVEWPKVSWTCADFGMNCLK